MARGNPAFWSSLVGLLFSGVGVYLYITEASYPTNLGLPFIVFGMFILAVGFYIQLVAAPSPPSLSGAEEIITTRHPSQRVAVAKIAFGLPFLLMAGYWYFFSRVPYVYPTITFFIGLFGLSTGLYTYWVNTLTTYYVTTDRAIKNYRFISLIQKELPLNKVRGIEERKSVTEALVGLGNVRIASGGGGGGTLEIIVRNVENSTGFADELRNQI